MRTRLMLLALVAFAASMAVLRVAGGPVVFDSQITRGLRISNFPLRKPCTYVSTGDVVISVDWRITSATGTTVWQAPVKDFTRPYCLNDGADFDPRMLRDGNYKLVVTVDNVTSADSTATIPFSVALENRPNLAQQFVDAASTCTTGCGSKASPHKTIAAAVTAAASGQTILVRPGTYREAVTIPSGRTGLTLIGQRDTSANLASWRGSNVVSAWTNAGGNLWYATTDSTGATLVDWPLAADQCLGDTDWRCRAREQLFVDGVEVFQETPNNRTGVARVPDGISRRQQTWLSALGSTDRWYRATGDFSRELNNRYELNLGSTDPNTVTVEVSQRDYWLRAADATNADTTVRGFDFRQCANDLQTGCIRDENSGGWMIEFNSASYSHSYLARTRGGMSINYRPLTIRNNSFTHSGQMLLGGDTVSGSSLVRNLLAYGNREETSDTWEAGGIKWAYTSGQIEWRENEVAYNLGPGLWCDIDCGESANDSFTATGNRLYGNTRQGLSFEISGAQAPYEATGATTTTCRVQANRAWENGWFQYGPYDDFYASDGTYQTASETGSRTKASISDTWLWGAGIMIHNSSSCDVSDNVLAWNSDGITVVQQCRARWDQWPDAKVSDTTNDASSTNDNPCLWGTDGVVGGTGSAADTFQSDSWSDRTRIWNVAVFDNVIALKTINTNNNYGLAWSGDFQGRCATAYNTYQATGQNCRRQQADGGMTDGSTQGLYRNRGYGNAFYRDTVNGGGGQVGYCLFSCSYNDVAAFNTTVSGGFGGSGDAANTPSTETDISVTANLTSLQNAYLIPNGMPVTQR